MPMNEVEWIWMDGRFVKWKDANVHILTHALHYGSAVFEGIRCYDTPKGPAVFRLKDHLARLANSAKALGMKMPFSGKQLHDASLELIRKNRLKECYVRPLVYYGYGQMGLNPIGAPVNAALAAWPWGAYLPKGGIRVKVSPWRRHSPKAMPLEAKVCGAYVNSILAKVDAVSTGFDEALLADEDGNIAEATGENVFIVKHGTLITPPRGNILLGITRESVMEIAKDLGITVREKQISREQLYDADEAFLTGTAAEIAPIMEIDNRKIGSGKPGEITKKLQSAFYDAIHGKIPKYEKWLDYAK